MRSSKAQVPSSKEAAGFKRRTAGGSISYFDRVSGVNPEPWALDDGPIADGGRERPFDLEERTARFGEEVIKFAKMIPFNARNDRLISQLVGAATSVGANYSEASESVSKRDFRYPISRCKKEAKESKHFLRMVVASEPQLADSARPLYREAHELLRIFNSMYRK